MVLRTVGEVLPAALAIALSPFPVIAIVLLLGSAHGRRNGVAFAFGWVVALSALMAAVVLLMNGTDEADGTSAALFDWSRVVVGLLLIGLAVKKWRSRPRSSDEVVLPGWIAAIDAATPARSLVIGLALAGINPKHLAIAASAAASITDISTTRDDAVIAIIVFVVLASSSVLGAVLFHAVGGQRAAAPLESVKQFMLANNAVIMMVVLLVLGAKILGDGLGAIST
jgi:threonine/homoserine/homoserine lactone efflux protein